MRQLHTINLLAVTSLWPCFVTAHQVPTVNG